MTSAFNKLMGGLDEVESYLSCDGKGFQVHVPDAVDVKSIRQNLHMTQAGFPRPSDSASMKRKLSICFGLLLKHCAAELVDMLMDSSLVGRELLR